MEEELLGRFFNERLKTLLANGSIYEEYAETGEVKLLNQEDRKTFCEFKTVEDWNKYKSYLDTLTFP